MKLFITGTDTDVGKTWISAAIAKLALEKETRVAYYKPIQTGCSLTAAEDPEFIKTTFGERVTTFNRYCFEPPVTPLVADTELSIRFETIRQDIQTLEESHDLILVEGAGGLMVPVTPDALMIDLLADMDMPALLVAHSKLGTLNHTLLSIEALTRRNIPLVGVVLNYYPEDLAKSDLAVQTVLAVLHQFVPETLPIWTAEANSDFITTISF
jgi:dethiobiotin synthetase